MSSSSDNDADEDDDNGGEDEDDDEGVDEDYESGSSVPLSEDQREWIAYQVCALSFLTRT